MKILLANYEYPPLGGGGGVASADLARELAKRHEITVITSQGLGLPEERIEDGVRVLRVPVMGRDKKSVASMLSMASYLPLAIRAGRRLLKEQSFDIINSQFVIPTSPVGHYFAHLSKLPHVVTIHGGDVYDPSKFSSPHNHLPLRFAVRQLLKRADAVIGSSHNVIQNMRVFYGHDIYTIRIPLGINLPEENGIADREKYGLSEDDFVFVTVGRLVSRKNIGDLIKMTNMLKHRKVHLLIMGTGPEREKLEALVAEYGIQNQVHFLGFVSDEEKPRVLRMADAYAMASTHEGFGLVFLEAMACGLPVVCYDYGGQTDFLKNDETGYVVPLGSVDRFAAACSRLIDNEELRKKMGDHNREVVKRYTIDTHARAYEDLFEEMIRKHQKASTAYPSMQFAQSSSGD